jgi:hypothetical protein
MRSDTDKISMAGIADALEEATPAQRRVLLDRHRKACGLPSVDEVLYEEGPGRGYIPDRRTHVFGLSPAGVPVDLTAAEDEANRQAEQARSRATLEAARAAERRVAAEERRAGQRALRARAQREAPDGIALWPRTRVSASTRQDMPAWRSPLARKSVT